MAYEPRFRNLVQILEQSTERYGHKPLFGTRAPEGWQWTTYADFNRRVTQARNALYGLGVRPGDRVAAISNNRLEWAIFAYGTYTLGGAYVPMYEAQATDDWAYILRDSGAKVCFVANATIRDKIKGIRDELPELTHVFCFECGDAVELLSSAKPIDVQLPRPQESDVASIIYTSGTTGRPKGVELTHFNLASNVSACLDVAPMAGEERTLAFLPWAHVFGGQLEINTLLAYGGSMAICSDASRLLEFLPEVQPTMMFAVPRIWNRVYDGVKKQIASKPKAIQALFDKGMQAKNKEKTGEPLSLKEKATLALAEKLVFSKIVARFGGKLRFAFSGAAALSPEVGRFVDNLGIVVLEGYGLSETSAGTTGSKPNERRIGSVGKPMPGISIRIDESAEGVSKGEGEIIVYGCGVMKGYHNLPEETRKSFTDDGGFRTGDLGRIDSDGFVYITGRVKELYKLENGKYIAPVALEEKIQLSPYIAQCVVVGSDKPYNVALVIPDMTTLRPWASSKGINGSDPVLLENPQVKKLVRAEIDAQSRDFKGFESIRDFILHHEEMTPDNGMLTPTLKVKRRVVMERFGKQLDSLYNT